MTKEFIEGEPHTDEDHEVNSLIMEQADDIATQLTELECKLNNIKCYDESIEDGVVIQRLTEEAEDIFSIYYDFYTTELYTLLNKQLSVIK